MKKVSIEPPAPRSSKGEPPIEPSRNLQKPSDGQMVNLNFSVPPEFRKQYKSFALEHDMTMLDVLYKSFEILKEKIKT